MAKKEKQPVLPNEDESANAVPVDQSMDATANAPMDADVNDGAAEIVEGQFLTTEEEDEPTEVFEIPEETEMGAQIAALAALNAERRNWEVGGRRIRATSQATRDVPAEFQGDAYEPSTSRRLAHATLADIRERRQDDNSAYARAVTAFRNNNIIYYRVAGVLTEGREVYWVCYDGRLEIRIPFNHTFMLLPEALATNPGAAVTGEVLERRKQLLNKAMGANISVIITGFEANADGNMVAMASRTTALAKMRRRYFGDRAQQPVKVGDEVVAHIITVGMWSIYVSAYGVDVRVPIRDLTCQYLAGVAEDYRAGSDVRMRVMSVDDSGAIPSLSLSARAIEIDEVIRPNLSRIRPLSTWCGKIISLRREKRPDQPPRIVVSLWLDGAEVPAFARSTFVRNNLRTGDTVIFEAHGVLQEQAMAHGKILKTIKRK